MYYVGTYSDPVGAINAQDSLAKNFPEVTFIVILGQIAGHPIDGDWATFAEACAYAHARQF
jgi:hypothetical protein